MHTTVRETLTWERSNQSTCKAYITSSLSDWSSFSIITFIICSVTTKLICNPMKLLFPVTIISLYKLNFSFEIAFHVHFLAVFIQTSNPVIWHWGVILILCVLSVYKWSHQYSCPNSPSLRTILFLSYFPSTFLFVFILGILLPFSSRTSLLSTDVVFCYIPFT